GRFLAFVAQVRERAEFAVNELPLRDRLFRLAGNVSEPLPETHLRIERVPQLVHDDRVLTAEPRDDLLARGFGVSEARAADAWLPHVLDPERVEGVGEALAHDLVERLAHRNGGGPVHRGDLVVDALIARRRLLCRGHESREALLTHLGHHALP